MLKDRAERRRPYLRDVGILAELPRNPYRYTDVEGKQLNGRRHEQQAQEIKRLNASCAFDAFVATGETPPKDGKS